MSNDASNARLKSEGDLNISARRAEWAREQNDAETQHWLEDDAKYFLHQSLSTPCLDVLAHADGPYIETLQGHRMLDLHGNNVHQVGFAHPRVIDAIKAQRDELSFCTRRYMNIAAIRLAQKLVELAPGNLNKVLFAPGGTSAVGMALKLAHAATGRHKTISLWESFHGGSLDAISVGGESIFRSGIGPLLPGTEHAPPPDLVRCVFGCGGTCNLRCAHYIEYMLEKEGDVGAVIAETVCSSPDIPPLEYWQRVRFAGDRHSALLILDEIPMCLGRTGKMFAVEHYGIVPDMLVLGKGLGGGVFPLAALVAREGLDVMRARALGHNTHEKNPVACAARLATIACIEEDRMLENAREVGSYALERMRRMRNAHQLIGDVRGLGLLLGIELVRDRTTRERASDEAEQVMYAAMRKGLNFKVTMGNILTLTPPLTSTRGEMDHALDIVEECLVQVSAPAGHV